MTNAFGRLGLAAAGLALLAGAVPALAHSDPRVAKTEKSAKSEKVKATRYCIDVEPATGSRIGRQICQTRTEWLAEGVDPLELKRK